MEMAGATSSPLLNLSSAWISSVPLRYGLAAMETGRLAAANLRTYWIVKPLRNKLEIVAMRVSRTPSDSTGNVWFRGGNAS